MIKTVTVIGANGTMGTNISAIFASFGNAKVYMVSRTIEKSKKAIEKATKSVKSNSISGNLIPADFAMLPECLKDSDLVFESVSENIITKKEINKTISEHVKDNTIICTGTSGLSVTELSNSLTSDQKKRYLGMHFYNPPYSLTLCEVIPTINTDIKLLEEIKKYLVTTLLRTIVVVNDSPAFLGNRTGFYFINEALIYAEKYKYNGGIDYIDSILGQFSGRSMAPLITADFVGLDVHKAIVENIKDNTKDNANSSFKFPTFAQKLVNEGKLGRKTRGGLYKQEVLENGEKRYLVYDIESGEYREVINYKFSFAEQMKENLEYGEYEKASQILVNNKSEESLLCLEFMLKYMIYSLQMSLEVANDIHAADHVMATGFNWCPPLAMIEFFGGVDKVAKLIESNPNVLISHAELKLLVAKYEKSHYDFRKFFKAKK